VFLFQNGLSLFQIGLLWSIREFTMYIFEIPSGVIADRFGKKNELIVCFLFYIASFLLFFTGTEFAIFVVAIILYGLGEAFRSGTHKAMIMRFLDVHELKENKSQVYGLTRSYSLIGSFVSSLLAIGLALLVNDLKWLFIFSIVPYFADILLIASYPSYLNEKRDDSFSIGSFFKHTVEALVYSFKTIKLRSRLIASASYNAMFKTLKDYLQPVIVSLGVGWVAYESTALVLEEKLMIGLMYGVIYLFSSVVTRNAYRLSHYFSSKQIVYATWFLSALTFLALGLFDSSLAVAGIAFLLLYALLNIRKPFMVEQIGDATMSEKRASVLSIDSQITSLLIIVFAPLLGWISDQFGLDTMFIIVAVALVVTFPIFGLLKEKKHLE
jgi:MFS family permease